MKRFIEGVDRSQITLVPDRLEDYVADDNPVRVVDALVDRLDLSGLGFQRVDPSVTGRPGYYRSDLLKLHIMAISTGFSRAATLNGKRRATWK